MFSSLLFSFSQAIAWSNTEKDTGTNDQQWGATKSSNSWSPPAVRVRRFEMTLESRAPWCCPLELKPGTGSHKKLILSLALGFLPGTWKTQCSDKYVRSKSLSWKNWSSLLISHNSDYSIFGNESSVGLGSLLPLSQRRAWFQSTTPPEARDCLLLLFPHLSQNNLPMAGEPPTLKSFKASDLKLGQSPAWLPLKAEILNTSPLLRTHS